MWATGSSARGRRVRNILREVDADLLIVTEGQRDLLPEGGHIVDAGSDWGGYDITKSPERRKTMLWSRKPLTDVTTVPSGTGGAGRVLVAHTDTPLGQVRVLAVCIPLGECSCEHWSPRRVELVRASRMLRPNRGVDGRVRPTDTHHRGRRLQPAATAGAAADPGPRAPPGNAGSLDPTYRRRRPVRAAHRSHRLRPELHQLANLVRHRRRGKVERSLGSDMHSCAP